MSNSSLELLRRIQLDEDSSLELKSIVFKGGKVLGPSRNRLANELAAFANSRGGVLVLGVDDKTRNIIGIPIVRLDLVEQYVFEICNESIEPPLPFFSLRAELPDATGGLRALLKVEIPRGLFLHRSPGGTISGKAARCARCLRSTFCALGSREARGAGTHLMNRQCLRRLSQILS